MPVLSEKEPLFNALLDSIQSFTSPYTQAITLTHIAEQLFRLNDSKRSDEFFNKALAIAEQMPSSLEQLDVLQHLIGMLANVIEQTNDREKFETAITISKSIYLPYNRLYNLLDLLKTFFSLLGKGRTLEVINEILPEIDAITSKSYRFELLSEVVTVLCELGSAFHDLEIIQQAQQDLEKIEVSSFYYIALLSIAKAFLQFGEANRDPTWVSNALELLMKLPEISSLTTTLIDVSLTLISMGETKKAEGLINDAINNAEKIEHSSGRPIAHSYIAKALIILNESVKAKQQLLKAVEAVQAVEDPQLLEEGWQSIVEALRAMKSGDRLSLIQELVEKVETISEVTLRAFAFNHIITAITESEHIEPSFCEEILGKAVATIKTIRNKLVLETAALNLAAHLIDLSSKMATDLFFKTIYELVEHIKDVSNSAYLFTDIARVVWSSGREKEAEDLLEAARAFANQIPSAFAKVHALLYVAKGCLELGLQNKFTDLIKEAIELVDELTISDELVKLETSIAELFIQGNERERAAQFLHQAIEKSNELPNELEKSNALSSIAEIVLNL